MEFNRLLQIRRIYAQRAALELPRGKEIIERWPDADVVLVDNHWNIPEVHGDETNVPRWSRIKTEALVLGVKKALPVKPNGRSADFIAPSTANGCAMACAYCYVPRHKGYSNPVTVFANIDQIAGALERRQCSAGTTAVTRGSAFPSCPRIWRSRLTSGPRRWLNAWLQSTTSSMPGTRCT